MDTVERIWGMKALRTALSTGFVLMLLLAGNAYGQVPEYTYRATRYMPEAESSDFTSLADAEAYI